MFSEFPGGPASIADGLIPILSISDLLKLLTLIDVLMTLYWHIFGVAKKKCILIWQRSAGII
jgi:hypothetical protein